MAVAEAPEEQARRAEQSQGRSQAPQARFPAIQGCIGHQRGQQGPREAEADGQGSGCDQAPEAETLRMSAFLHMPWIAQELTWLLQTSIPPMTPPVRPA